MLTIAFLIIAISFVVYQRFREGRWFNLISLFVVPYIVIVSINNFYFYKLGFFKISDDVLLMLIGAFTAFFLGTLPFKFKLVKHKDRINIKIFEVYNLKAIKLFLYITGILGILQAIILYRKGILLNPEVDYEGLMGNGPIAHLLLASYSILPIYFLNWTYKKSISGIIPIVLILMVAFSSFIKYNVIGPIIILFIFVCIYRKSLLTKGLMFFSILIVFFFIINYAVSFAVSGADVPAEFYLYHFWKYFAGSLIYDNYIFSLGIRVGVSIFHKILIFLFALPNMFIVKIADEPLYPHVGQEMLPVNNLSEGSNVVDFIGYLFPSKGDFGEILIFLIVMFIIGFVYSYIYIKSSNKQHDFSPFLAIFLTYFVLLDFFAPFFVLAGPWEILVWSLFLPSLFKNKFIGKCTNLLKLSIK